MRHAFYCFALLALFAGCKAKKESAPPEPMMNELTIEELRQLEAESLAAEDGPGSNRFKRENWVPSEHKEGGAKWKDTGVYVDGRPVGMLNFGELPVKLQPVWKEELASAPKKYGSTDPGYKTVRQRHYRFSDYLTALGVDLKKVNEIHVYGPKYTNTIIATGADLRSEKGKEFMFRFGGEVEGKAIPVVPESFGNGKSPDKISAVLVYLEKTPPKLVRNRGMQLDGEFVTDVPYYGEPLRGGVRIYYDDKLAAVIKRKLLEDPAIAAKKENGEVAWNLLGFLESQGVNTKRIAEAWIVRDERRIEKLSRDELAHATFDASPQASGEIRLGEKKLPAQVLALHSRPVKPEDLPKILPEEEM